MLTRADIKIGECFTYQRDSTETPRVAVKASATINGLPARWRVDQQRNGFGLAADSTYSVELLEDYRTHPEPTPRGVEMNVLRPTEILVGDVLLGWCNEWLAVNLIKEFGHGHLVTTVDSVGFRVNGQQSYYFVRGGRLQISKATIRRQVTDEALYNQAKAKVATIRQHGSTIRARVDGLTLDECLRRYQYAMRHELVRKQILPGTVYGRPYVGPCGSPLDALMIENQLTCDQLEAAQVEFSLRVRIQAKRLREKERLQVTCDSQEED